MRCLSLVVVGLTLAATTASAEPLRLADTELDRVTADVPNVDVVAWVVEARAYDGRDTDDTTVRILSDTGSDDDIGFMDEGSTTDPEHDDVDHAVPVSDVRSTTAPISAVRVSTADAGNAVGGSDAMILRSDAVAGVIVLDRGGTVGNDASAAGTRTVTRQIVVRTSSTDNRAVVQTTSSVTRTGNADSLKAVSTGGVERSIVVRTDNASSGAGSRATSLFSGNGNAGLSTGRLATGITAGGFKASALAGSSVTSMLGGGLN